MRKGKRIMATSKHDMSLKLRLFGDLLGGMAPEASLGVAAFPYDCNIQTVHIVGGRPPHEGRSDTVPE